MAAHRTRKHILAGYFDWGGGGDNLEREPTGASKGASSAKGKTLRGRDVPEGRSFRVKMTEVIEVTNLGYTVKNNCKLTGFLACKITSFGRFSIITVFFW